MRYLVRTTYDTTEPVLIPGMSLMVNVWMAEGKIFGPPSVNLTETQYIVTRECSSRENADAWAEAVLSFFQEQPTTTVHPSSVTVSEESE